MCFCTRHRHVCETDLLKKMKTRKEPHKLYHRQNIASFLFLKSIIVCEEK